MNVLDKTYREMEKARLSFPEGDIENKKQGTEVSGNDLTTRGKGIQIRVGIQYFRELAGKSQGMSHGTILRRVAVASCEGWKTVVEKGGRRSEAIRRVVRAPWCKPAEAEQEMEEVWKSR